MIDHFVVDMYKTPLIDFLEMCPQKPYTMVFFFDQYFNSFDSTKNQLIRNIKDNTKVDWDAFSKNSSCLLDPEFDENYFTEYIISIGTKCFKQTKQEVVEEDKKAAKEKFHQSVCSAIQME